MLRTLSLASYTPLDDKDRPEAGTPNYPKFGATVAKYRKMPRTPENIEAHAEAIFAQLRTFQAQEFRRGTIEPERACPCASGTWHTDGKKILKAINAQNRAASEAGLAESWRHRSDAQVEIAYLAAMNGKDAPLTHNIHVPGSQSRYR